MPTRPPAPVSGTVRQPVSVLLFSASLRSGSLNARLASVAHGVLEDIGATVDRADLREFDAPTYDGDLEDAEGIPPGPTELRRRLEATDGFVVVSPEYNGSMPGGLKNVVDWVSRFRPQPFNGRHCQLLSASPSMIGGTRGLLSLRVPLEHLGARVAPSMFSLAQAHEQLAPDGGLADPALTRRLTTVLTSFLDSVEATKHYPCARQAWIEFPGERPTPATSRAE